MGESTYILKHRLRLKIFPRTKLQVLIQHTHG